MNEYIERQQRVYYMTELSAAFYLLKLGKNNGLMKKLPTQL